jgi:KilA-N domain
METIQILEFKGKQIEFDLSKENIMVNATEMAKVFNARINDFFTNDSTKKFIEACLNNGNSRYLGIENEGNLYSSTQRSGTWMHRVLALKFAAWLDPEFELWVYCTIDRLMFGDLRNMLSEKAKVDQEVRQAKRELYEGSEQYQALRLLEHKANSLKSKIASFSKSQYQLFLESRNDDIN